MFHIYRQDHTGRGVQHNPVALPTFEFAEAYLLLAKAANVRTALNPCPAFYLVTQAVDGSRRALDYR